MKFFQNWTERIFYWQFLTSLRNIRVRFYLKCMISAKLLLLIHKWSFEKCSCMLDGPSKTLLFYFSFYWFWQLSNHFCEKSSEKTTSFYDRYKKFVLITTLSQIFVVWKYLTVKWRSFKYFYKFVRKCVFIVCFH